MYWAQLGLAELKGNCCHNQLGSAPSAQNIANWIAQDARDRGQAAARQREGLSTAERRGAGTAAPRTGGRSKPTPGFPADGALHTAIASGKHHETRLCSAILPSLAFRPSDHELTIGVPKAWSCSLCAATELKCRKDRLASGVVDRPFTRRAARGVRRPGAALRVSWVVAGIC
jgi:hypothetical protein